jgi:hypothetical protein
MGFLIYPVGVGNGQQRLRYFLIGLVAFLSTAALVKNSMANPRAIAPGQKFNLLFMLCKGS